MTTLTPATVEACAVCDAPATDHTRDVNASGPWVPVCGDACAEKALAHAKDCDCDLCAEDRAARWVVIDRQWSPVLVIGPFATEADAQHSMNCSVLVDAICQDDCLDAYTLAGSDLPDGADVLIVDPTDNYHTAADVPREDCVCAMAAKADAAAATA